MALPLQPQLAPSPRWWRTLLVATGLVAGLLLCGWIGIVRRPPVELIITGPGEPLAYARAAERLIAGAQHRVWVLQYVVRPDENGPVHQLLSALSAAHARGVEVTVGLDRSKVFGGDGPDPKNDAAAAWLTAQGITVVWDEETRTSHAKVIIVDDRIALIGSHNWTRAALVDNREVSVSLSDPAHLARLRRLLLGIPGWPKQP